MSYAASLEKKVQPARDEWYFNQARIADAFERLPTYVLPSPKNETQLRLSRAVTGVYGKIKRGDKDEALACLREIHEKVWLVWADPISPRGKSRVAPPRKVRRVGYWGQIWALVILSSLGSANRGSLGDLVKDILAYGQRVGILSKASWQHELLRLEAHQLKSVHIKDNDLLLTDEEVLTSLLYRGPVAKNRAQDKQSKGSVIPPLEGSLKIRECIVDFTLDSLKRSVIYAPVNYTSKDEIIAHLDTVDYESPQGCFWGVVAFLGLTSQVQARESDEGAIPKQTELSWLEPRIWRYVKSPDSERYIAPPLDGEQQLRNIERTLAYQGKPFDENSPIAILTGPVHSGKKAVVGDLFKKIDKQRNNAELCLECTPRDGGNTVKMPVLCVQTTDRDYFRLCVEVLVFLERVNKKNENYKSKVSSQEEMVKERLAVLNQAGSAPSLQAIMEHIISLHHKTPAFFVFMDVALSSNDIGSMIRRNGNRRLLESLLQSNSESRFLLTMEEVPGWLKNYKNKEFSLLPTTGERIEWYLSDDDLAKFKDALALQRNGGLLQSPIPGNVLMALSVLFSYDELPSDEFFGLFGSCAVSERTTGQAALRKVCQHLLRVWRARGFIPYISLILASDDGMMRSTIDACLNDWQDAFPALVLADRAEGFDQLTKLSRLGRGFFLRFQEPLEFVAEETRFDEPSFDEVRGENIYKTWQFETGASKVLRSLLVERPEDQELMRASYRLVAIQARERARFRQLKGMKVQRSYGLQVPERSVQAFVALMLSLEPRGVAHEPANRDAVFSHVPLVSLRHATRQVFTLSPDRFDQGIAIRYAYHVLLRDEADRNYRMSMSLDADKMRLSLYTLLCVEPGAIRIWDDEHIQRDSQSLLKALGSSLPAHFTLFSIRERAEILASLAMSAFYSANYSIMGWAEQQLWSLISQDRRVAEPLSRVVAARVDIECQTGEPMPVRRDMAKADGGNNKLAAQTEAPNDDRALRLVRKSLANNLLSLFPPSDTSADIASPGPDISQEEAHAWLRMQTRLAYLDWLVDPNANLEERFAWLAKVEQSLAEATPSQRSVVMQGRSARLQMRARLNGFPVLYASHGRGWATPFRPEDLIGAYTSVVQANISRLALFAGSERALTLADHARELMLRGIVPAARLAIREARRISFLGTSSDGIRLEILFLESAILLAQIDLIRAGDSRGSAVGYRALFDSVGQNFHFIKQILQSHKWHLEVVTYNVLLGRAQRLASSMSFSSDEFKSKDAPFDTAHEIAAKYEAWGIVALLDKINGLAQ